MGLFNKKEYKTIDISELDKQQDEILQLRKENNEIKKMLEIEKEYAGKMQELYIMAQEFGSKLKKVNNRLREETKELSQKYTEVSNKEFREKRWNKQLQEENEKLKKKIERLEAEKEIQLLKEEPVHTTNLTITYFNPDDYRIVDCREDLYSIFDNVVTAKELKYQEKEHKCTEECFGKHVLKTINRDKFMGHFDKFDNYFIKYWCDKLCEEYNFLYVLYYDTRGQIKAVFK